MGGDDEPSSPGYSFKTTKPGDAAHFPGEGYSVSIHYIGRLAEDNTVFDSSRDRKRPLQCKIGVGQLIRAWEEVIPKMSVGQRIELTVQPEYGYGVNGYPPIVPAYSVLIYDIELLNFSSP
ncbi:unnamed protein product [Discosporangium mesarthrocarpum]